LGNDNGISALISLHNQIGGFKVKGEVEERITGTFGSFADFNVVRDTRLN
jgi:hypothetical protein